MDRLRRLEGVVQSLNAQVEEHEQEAAHRDRKTAELELTPVEDEGNIENCPSAPKAKRGSVIIDGSVEGLETRFGRLVVDQGRSRYINNSFWASLNNEVGSLFVVARSSWAWFSNPKQVEDLKSILIENSDDDETHDSPDTSSSQHSSFFFGYSSSSVDMLSLHPTLKQGFVFWNIYKANVDPLVKVLHIPTCT